MSSCQPVCYIGGSVCHHVSLFVTLTVVEVYVIMSACLLHLHRWKCMSSCQPVCYIGGSVCHVSLFVT